MQLHGHKISLPVSYEQVSSAHKKIMELNYFLHYYSRFKNHENSYKVRYIKQKNIDTCCCNFNFLFDAIVGAVGTILSF
mgnify:CR=1 FL=1